MRHLVPTAALLTSIASAALAQTTMTPAQPVNPAVKGMHDNNSATPVPGANSFTKSQAIKQIQAKGYTHVTDLMKDQSGVWRGTATKDGQSGPISVDYQGNVN